MTITTDDPVAFIGQLSQMMAYMVEVPTQKVQEDEARLEQVSRELEESKQQLTTWQNALRYAQESNGSPDKRYATLSPTEAIDLWADEHGDIVKVKELVAKVLDSGGQYRTRRQANASIDSTVRKNFLWKSAEVFERFVRYLVQTVARTRLPGVRLAGERIRLADPSVQDVGPLWTVPDIRLEQVGRTIGVLDAKYKVWQSQPTAR